eukprot:jgi/Hompol1/4639/HPOL_001819-RA
MSAVRLNWDFMTASEFNPIPYALSLLDGSSMGRDFQAFCDVHDTLEKAMDLIVNDYHQAFNSAIQAFSSVVDTISESQRKVNEMRTSLEQSKGWLECKRFDLLHLWVKSIQFKEMSRILETIGEMQKTPAHIETLIEGKYFLSAVRTLTGAIRTLTGTDFSEIGAVQGVKEKLEEIKKNVFDTIVEELHDHIYLKTPMSLARLEAMILISRENVEMMDGSEFQFFSPAKIAHVEKQIRSEIIDDFEINPELDTFRHIQSLVESLAILDRLSDALEILGDRMSQEVFLVVEKTIDEVEYNSMVVQKEAAARQDETGAKAAKSSLFLNLLLSLYDKLECVVFGHTFVLDISERILEKYPYSSQDVCVAVEKEIKSLLCDYLTTTEKVATGTSTVVSMNEVLRDKKRSGPEKTTKVRPLIVTDYIRRIGVSDKYASVAATGHKLLVSPDAANIVDAFKPSSQFMENLEITTKAEQSQGFNVFLDDFVLNIFLPSLNDQIMSYYHNYVNGIDAFQTETIPDVPFPLIKSSIAFAYLVQSMCQMSHTVPIHKEEFLTTLTVLTGRYLEKCQTRFRSLTVIEQSQSDSPDDVAATTIAPSWAKNSEIVAILAQNALLFSSDSLPALVNDGATLTQAYFSPEQAAQFATLTESFKALSATAIYSLRIELRCHSMYYLDLAIREGNYVFDDSNPDPDPYISMLNLDLSTAEETMTSALPECRVRFLYDGLGELMAHILVKNMRHIRAVNKNGVLRLIRNVQSLQQNLTNLACIHQQSLDRARRYYELLLLESQDIINTVTDCPGMFSYEEYKVVLELVYHDAIVEDGPGAKVYAASLQVLKDYCSKAILREK